MAWYVYMLRCGDGSLYTGSTTDVIAVTKCTYSYSCSKRKLALIEGGTP